MNALDHQLLDGYGDGITVVGLEGGAPPVRLAAGERPLGIAVL